MAIEIDGAAVLRAVLERAALFPDAAADFAKTARALVVRQIKAKSTGLGDLRAITQAIGVPALTLIVDGLNEADVRSLAARWDKTLEDVRTAAPTTLRGHLVALASRPAAESTPEKASAGEPIEPPPLRHESVQAKRKKGKKK